MGPDDLTPEETQKYEALAASGNQEELMDFINGLSCKYDQRPANFGDGAHRTCAVGGKKRRSRKKSSKRKSRKSRKSRKHKKSHKKGRR